MSETHRPPYQPECSAARTLAVLVVDDDDFQRRHIIRLLNHIGVNRIREAEDGEAALALLKQERRMPDLVLCDLKMPRMDGMAFLRNLTAIKYHGSVALISGENQTILRSVRTMCEAYQISPVAALSKPVALDALKDLLEKVGARDRVLERELRVPQFSLREIEQGIESGQFHAHFQPKVALKTGCVVGAEALCRWHHPMHGVLLPYPHFIGLLEEAGRLEELTLQMVEQAARACLEWQKYGHEISVAVNLSLATLIDPEHANRIAETVERVGLQPSSMTFEVTETAAVVKLAPVLENMARLRLLGFGLAIDDFGTGFASLEQLSLAAFTELKIDRGFIAGMLDRVEHNAIVDLSIDMVSRLGLVAVAEGVETQAQWDALLQRGCDVAQGYYTSRPLDRTHFRHFLEAHQHQAAH